MSSVGLHPDTHTSSLLVTIARISFLPFPVPSPFSCWCCLGSLCPETLALQSLTQSQLLRVCSLSQNISLVHLLFFFSPLPGILPLTSGLRWNAARQDVGCVFPMATIVLDDSPWSVRGACSPWGGPWPSEENWHAHVPTFLFLGLLSSAASLCKPSREILCTEKACLPRHLLCFFGALLSSWAWIIHAPSLSHFLVFS